MSEIPLFRLSPAIDRAAAAARFAATGRLQIRDFLIPEAAATIHRVLTSETPWGLALESGDGPRDYPAAQAAALSQAERAAAGQAVGQTLRGKGYGFVYQRYGLISAYLAGRDPDGPLALLVEHINDAPLMDLVRGVTAIPELKKADAQATLFAPGQFLGMHDDSDSKTWGAGGRRIAYVMNFTPDWHPDWGGYLNFLDDAGDIIAGLAPRFNSLNLFRVPQRHQVSYVPPWAPPQRFAITGWFMDQ